jgi:aminoglycoside phosphotransferase (APT) family kinase protein
VRDRTSKLPAGYDAEGLLSAWDEALETQPWGGPPTWCHCDLDLRNIVFLDGRPSAVLDWGWAGAGDPASDAAAAWKVLPAESRTLFWEALGADEVEIARARGWTLMQCAGALSYYTPENNPALFHEAERWLSELLGSAPTRS